VEQDETGTRRLRLRSGNLPVTWRLSTARVTRCLRP